MVFKILHDTFVSQRGYIQNKPKWKYSQSRSSWEGMPDSHLFLKDKR